MIKTTVVSRKKSITLKLYKAFVRPHLKYCMQVWNSLLKKDIETLERMQRRATSLTRGLRNLSCEERLRRCKLTNLEIRRSRGDLIETFKIITERENLPPEYFFGHQKQFHNKDECKLYRKATGTLKNNYFTREINLWNKLVEETIYSDSVDLL